MIDHTHVDRRSNSAIPPVPGHQPARWRRWFQYRLRTLLIVIVLAALASAAWAKYIEPYRRERQLERMVTEMGGTVSTEAAGPEWLQLVVGPGRTSVVTTISLSPSTSSVGWNGWTDWRPDAKLLDRIAGTQRLRSLELAHRQLEDDDLVRLAPLQLLENLDLSFNSITDAGVRNLESLRNLRSLRLTGNALTDDSLRSLEQLPNLQIVTLDGTHVTPAGLSAFRNRRGAPKVSYLRFRFMYFVPDRPKEVFAFNGHRIQLRDAWFEVTNHGDRDVLFADGMGLVVQLPGNKRGMFHTRGSKSDLGGNYIAPAQNYPLSALVPVANPDVVPLWFGLIGRSDGFASEVLVPIDAQQFANE